jgi:IS605 OrfB family transposase
MRRFAFNRFQDGVKQREIYQLINDKFDINCHLKNSAVRNANGLFTLNKNKKVHFGKFLRFQRGLITKDELKDSRDSGIISEGEMNQKGNRLFKIDIENSKFIYKRACKEHYDLKIVEKLSDKRRIILSKLEILMSEKKIPVTIRLKKDHIYLSYDEKIVEKEKQFKNLFKNRVLGIDLNPNYFGISIIEFNHQDKYHVIHKEVIDLNELQKQSKNKIHHELYEINHHILKLCKQWHVSKLAIEDLKFAKNKFWSKDLNRLCKNKFRYSFVKSHLQTLCNVYGVELIEVNAAYSSIIGNFKHGSESCPDMIAASIEIARRAYKKFEKGWIYPKIVSDQRI